MAHLHLSVRRVRTSLDPLLTVNLRDRLSSIQRHKAVIKAEVLKRKTETKHL